MPLNVPVLSLSKKKSIQHFFNAAANNISQDSSESSRSASAADTIYINRHKV
jgi:hypothetical protein